MTSSTMSSVALLKSDLNGGMDVRDNSKQAITKHSSYGENLTPEQSFEGDSEDEALVIDTGSSSTAVKKQDKMNMMTPEGFDSNNNNEISHCNTDRNNNDDQATDNNALGGECLAVTESSAITALARGVVSRTALATGKQRPAAPQSVCRNYKCKLCTYATTKAKVYLYHMKHGHGENLSIFPCDLCDYASKHKGKVLRHRKFIHSTAEDMEPEDLVPENDISSPEAQEAISKMHAYENEDSSTLDDQERDFDSLSPSSETTDFESRAAIGMPSPLEENDNVSNVDDDVDEGNESLDLSMKSEGSNTSREDLVFRPEVSDSPDVLTPRQSSPIEDVSVVKAEPAKQIATTENALDYVVTLSERPANFKCKLCSYAHLQKFNVINHVRSTHIKQKLYKCTQCDFETGEKIQFCLHKNQHAIKQAYACNECSFRTESRVMFDNHVTSHTTEQETLQCHLCSFSTPTESAMQQHVTEAHAFEKADSPASMDGIEPGEVLPGSSIVPPPTLPNLSNFSQVTDLLQGTDIRCNICHLNLQSEAKLRIHMIAHTPNSVHVCPLCPLKYKRTSDLNRHMKRKHNTRLRDYLASEQDEPLNLSVKRSFQSTSSSDEDQPLDLSVAANPAKKMKTSTSNETLRCQNCSYVAKWPSDLHRHMLVHSVEKRFRCTHCHRRYKYKFDLNMHLRKMHKISAGRVKLSDNNFQFGTSAPEQTVDEDLVIDEDSGNDSMVSNNNNLKDASDVKSSPSQSPFSIPTTPPKPFVVQLRPSQAEKLLKSPRQLQLSPAGKFKCDYCPYLGACRSEVERHTRLHTGEKPYSCLFCTYKSHWKGDMKRHVQKHHSDQLHSEKDIYDIMEKSYQPSNVYEQNSGSTTNAAKVATNHIENKPIRTMLRPAMQAVFPRTGSADDEAHASVKMSPVFPQPTPVSKRTGSVCPYCPFVSDAPSKLKCHMEIHENLKRYKCAYCGRRSNWAMDIRKHIKKEHAQDAMKVIVMHETEARNSLQEYFLELQKNSKENRSEDSSPTETTSTGAETTPPEKEEDKQEELHDDLKPYFCSICEYSAHTSDQILSHISASHPCLTEDHNLGQSDNTPVWPEAVPIADNLYESSLDDIKDEHSEDEINDPSSSDYIQQVDPKKLKRFKCAFCPYRSNYRSDVGRHTRRLHRNVATQVVVLTEVHAASTLKDYKDKFGHKKFVLSHQPRHKKKLTSVSSLSPAYNEGIFTSSPGDGDSDYSGGGSQQGDPGLFTVPRVHQTGQSNALHSASANHSGLEQVGQTYSPDSLVHGLDGNSRHKFAQYRQGLHVVVVEGDHLALKPRQWWCCNLCDFKDEELHLAEEHLQNHPKMPVFRCDICNKTYKHRRATLRHLNRHHDLHSPEASKYIIQGMGYPDRAKNETTLDEESGDASKDLECLICGDVFNQLRDIVHHAAEIHPDMKLSDVYDDKTPRNGNDESNHEAMDTSTDVSSLPDTDDKQMSCSICPYRTNLQSLLKIHKSYHKPQRGNKYKCKFCNYYVSATKLLQQHVRLHLEAAGDGKKLDMDASLDPLYYSEIGVNGSESTQQTSAPSSPGKSSVNQSTPNKNESDLPRRHACNLCPFQCRNKNDFIYHKQFHQRKPSAPYKCKNCEYWVSQRRLLRQHERVHQPSYGLQMQATLKQEWPLMPLLQDSSTKSDDSFDEEEVELAYLKGKLISSKFVGAPLDKDRFYKDGDVNKDPYAMDVCTVSSSGAVTGRDTIRKMHKCPHCPYTNIRASQMSQHVLMHQPKDGPHVTKCPFCSYNVMNKGLLAQHLRVHSQQFKPGQHEIHDIETEAEREKMLKEEVVDEEIQKETESVTVKTEKESDPNNRSATSSPELVIPDTDQLDSSALPAGSEFYVKMNSDTGEKVLERVMVKKWCCEKCPYATMKRLQFENHCFLHGCDLSFSCEFCDYSVPKFKLLENHRKLHFKPNGNLLSYQSFQSLTQMPEIPADVAAAADFPGHFAHPAAKGSTHEDLDLYENSEEFTKPQRQLNCDRCPYSTIHKKDLLKHLIFHSMKSPLQCQFCSFSTKETHTLQQHVPLHFSEMPMNSKGPSLRDLVLDGAIDFSQKKQDAGVSSRKQANPKPVEMNNNNDLDTFTRSLELKRQNIEEAKESIDDDDDGDTMWLCQFCERALPSAQKLMQHELKHNCTQEVST